MDGRQEYSLERSRLLAAGLVMTPGYVEPSQPSGPSSLLRGGLADLGRSAPPPPHPSPGTPGLSSAAAFQQYHGRCLSSIPNSAGTNFQSFLNGVLTGSMPAPASSPYRAPPGVPSIRHLWPPVPPTPEDYDRCLSSQPSSPFCSQYCRCHRQMGYGRCGMNAGLYSLFPMVSSSDTSSSLYSQTSLSRLATSQNSFQHLCENPKDLVFPSGIQLSTMIPPPQHLPHTSPSTPSLQELERNGLSQMEYYPAKGLDNGSRRSVDLWSDLRTVTRNDSNNNTMPNPTNGLLSPHSHPYQSHGSKKREQHVRHLERKSEATDERRGLREGGKKPREIKQESVRKEDAAVCKKPHCNDDVITGRQPESYAARCTPLHGDAPGSSGRDQGGKAVAIPAPVPGPQPDKRSADPETARDSPVKTEKPSADKCQVRTQATVTVTTTTLTQSSGGTNTLTTTPSPRDNEYPTTPYAQRKTTATKVVSSVLTTSSNLNISSSNNKDNLKEHSVNNITKLASVPSGNALTTSQVKQPDRSSPFVNHTPTSLNGVTSTSPVVISNSEKQWKGVQTVKPVLDKTENKHSSLEIPQKSCTSRVVIKQETTYESSCVSGRKFSTAIDTSVSIRSSTGKDCMFVNNTSHLVNSDIKNSDGLCNSQSAFIGQRQTNTLSKSSANVLISKKDPHTKQNKRKIGKLYPIHSQYSRNTVHKETVKLHDNSQSQYCDIVSNCCLPKSSVQIGTAAKVDSSSHSNSADIMSISERQSVTSLQTMIAGTDHPQAALISVPENLPSTMTDQSCTTSALPPQYVFEWSSPQFSTASVTTLTTHPSYLIQHSSQTLHPDANSSTVTACTCTQGPIIVQTIPKTVIATTVDNASSDLLVNSHPPDHIILSHRANSNTHTSAAHEVKDMTSTLTQVVPVSVLTDNINDKTDLSKVQEQSTNDGPLLLHNPAVACSIPIGIAVARQRQEHSPSHTPIKRNEETVVNEEPTTDNCGAIDLRGEFLREQKEFLPRPKQPHTSNPPADLGSSIMVPGATTTSTGQWDDSTRTGAGLPPPWVPAPHSSAYWIPQGHYAAAPAPIPMQIGTMETSHLPIPPVGYQLVRDSITGHLLLIPANIDLMDRPTMWPTYATPATHLQSSHQLQQLIVHQQLLQQDQHRTMEYRLTVPQQFSSAEITKNQNTDMQNIEEIDETAEDCSDQNEQCENMQQSGLFADKKEDKDKSTVTISATPSAPPPAPPSIIASIPIAASQTFPFAFPAAPYFYEAAGVVQLAQAVQTDTGRRSQGTSPVLPDDCISMPIEQSAQTIDDSDSCESDRVGQEYIVTREEPQVADASNQTETPPLTEEEEDAEDVEASQISNGSETEKEPVTKQDVGVPCDSLPSDNEIQPSEEEEITTSEALKDVEIIDMHGLELLSNSIKVHEESHLDKMPQLEKSEPESVKEDKIEINQPKLEPQEPLFSNEGESSSDEKPPNIVPEGESPASLFSPENSMLEGIKTLGGLKLLCALAEQKFLDENLSSNTESEADKSSKPNTSSPKKEKCKNLETSSDLNRNYRNPKTQKEFKNLIANKMTQYMQPGAPKTPPGNDNLMDAAELEMRMRLADLQRRYKEKQRELAKLQPKKEKEECEKSPVKRGPGRPRKRKFFSMAKKMQKTSVENLVKNVVRHEISQPNFQTVIDEPSRKKKKKQGKLFNPIVCMSKSSPNSSVNKITNKPILKPPLLKANNLHNPTLVLINNNNKAKKPEEPSNATSIFHSTAERTNQLIKSKYGLAPQQPNPLTISAVKVQILSPVKDAAKTLNDQSGLEENAPETVKWVIENKTPTTELHSPSKTFGKNNALTTIETPKKTAKENTDKNKKVPGGTSSSENAKPVLSCESPSLFDKSDGLGLLAQFATHVVEQSRGEKRKHKETEGDATDASKSPTTASLSPSLSSSSKKRKPGRPKKHSPSRLKESTETIVAKKPKNINFLKLSQVIEDKSKKVKTETNKSNSVSETKAYYLEDEAWQRRRSERIFLNELNIVPSGGYSESGNRNILSPPHLKPATEEIPTWKTKTDEDLKPPKNLTRAPDVGKTKKKTTKSEPTKKQKTKDRQKRSKDRTVPEELFQALKEKCRLSDNTCGGLSPRDSDSDNLESSSYSEGENLPLSQLVERPITPEPRSCIISSEELADKLRVLTLMDGLFYAGHVNAIQAPDVYGITFDGERGNRPHIYSREEILKKVFLEVKPGSVRYLPEGTRISAYWSQQYRCLYPGTVAKSTSPNPVLDKNSVYVEFDDGDSGRIPLNDIRLLPPQFPIVSYDPSPLVFLGKRRSRSTQDSDKSNTNTDDKQKNSHKFNKMEETVNTTQAATSVITTNANVSSSNTSLSGSSKEKNGEETKKKSKKLKSESREKSRKSEDSNVNESDMPNEINKPKKHKKHRDKDRPEEHRHHHHHHHHHHKHKHKHDRHEKHGEEKESFRIPSSNATVTETHKVITTVTQQTGHLSDPKKSEFTMKFKTNTSELGQFEPSVTEDSETCNTWESSDSCKVTGPSAEVSENSDEDCATDSNSKKSKSKNEDNQKSKKRKERLPSVETKSKIAAFLPARQLWRWSGKSFKRPGTKGKAKKEFYKAITRGKETIMVGDCAVFLSTGRPHLPYIGRIEMMWEAWGGNMVVKVKWFYHPEETKGGRRLTDLKGALYQSPHVDENDVQTISHKCEVLSREEYKKHREKQAVAPTSKYESSLDNNDVYYLAGTYDPTTGMVTMEPGIC